MPLTVSQPSDSGGCATLISDTGSGHCERPWRRGSGGCRRIGGGLPEGYRGAAGPLLSALEVDLDQLREAAAAEVGGVQR
jgi:hypothetical protein